MLEFIVLGFIQGVFEWLPVSSEGFLVLTGSFFGFPAERLVDLALFLHLGTLLAVVVYFRRKLAMMLAGPGKEARFILVATLVSLAVSFPIYLVVDKIAAWTGSLLLALTALGLFFTGFLVKKRKKEPSRNWDATFAGFLQGLAIIPGVSRSGITLFALLSSGYEQEKALEVSFLMSIPVVLIGNVFLGLKPFLLGSEPLSFGLEHLVALVVALISGIFSIHLLLTFARRIDFSWFCWFFGAICLLGVILFA